jgi:hypothetical protein
MPDQLADVVRATRDSIRNLSKRIHALEIKESQVFAQGSQYSTFANLGTGVEGQMRKCINCRKSGEGSGAGTGLMVYWDPATASWLRYYDNSAATA